MSVMMSFSPVEALNHSTKAAPADELPAAAVQCPLSLPMQRWQQALQAKQAFKLIAGGSLTDAACVAACARIYAEVGVSCIDIAPQLAVVESVAEALSSIPVECRPLLMVSLPLDPDPHFQKIQLSADDCIACDACTPVCPTQALAVTPSSAQNSAPLHIDQPLCYGCGRCVPQCPTSALSLLPRHPHPAETLAVLAHPAVEAVEIHSHFADTALISEFLATYGEQLRGKVLALCFQPTVVPVEQWVEFVQVWAGWAKQHSPLPLILQIDGNPMSGTADQDAPMAAINSAWTVWQVLQVEFPEFEGWITLSGGMNGYAGPRLAQHAAQTVVAGIGVGTMARAQVWPWVSLLPSSSENSSQLAMVVPQEALNVARELVDTFTRR